MQIDNWHSKDLVHVITVTAFHISREDNKWLLATNSAHTFCFGTK